ncbi:hypothetical protein NDU88_000115 [Pleurodeles waltl]|uniref:Uncharacterized protein n=1 Tax=Pleurodeles waltl TaxID=8319 RepID=A0AAV7VX73_PLEWA|nr:hypothetical protein NDU88_000115 [Pleurodeles waltl]
MGSDAAPPGRRRAQNPYRHTTKRKRPQPCAVLSAFLLMLSGRPPRAQPSLPARVPEPHPARLVPHRQNPRPPANKGPMCRVVKRLLKKKTQMTPHLPLPHPLRLVHPSLTGPHKLT